MAKMTCPTESDANWSVADLERAAAILRAGGLVAFPTETVYGLGANAFDSAAVSKIFTAKGRPATSPLIVHVSSLAMAHSVVSEWPERAQLLAKRFWPGPLTLVLPKQDKIPASVTAGLPTVGVRMPNHPLALALIEAVSFPLAAPSANFFTRVSPTAAAHVVGMFGAFCEMILDGGPAHVGIESTVLSLANTDRPVLLRPGGISRSEIEEIVGPIEEQKETHSGNGSQPSPGLHKKHYSPQTPLVLTDQPEENGTVYLWWSHPRAAQRTVQMSSDPQVYARELYAMLHSLDGLGFRQIAVEPVPGTPAWTAVRDRLTRSAAR